MSAMLDFFGDRYSVLLHYGPSHIGAFRGVSVIDLCRDGRTALLQLFCFLSDSLLI